VISNQKLNDIFEVTYLNFNFLLPLKYSGLLLPIRQRKVSIPEAHYVRQRRRTEIVFGFINENEMNIKLKTKDQQLKTARKSLVFGH
jgi:hypothetical protein